MSYIASTSRRGQFTVAEVNQTWKIEKCSNVLFSEEKTQRYRHGKDLTPEMFSTRLSGGDFIMVCLFRQEYNAASSGGQSNSGELRPNGAKTALVIEGPCLCGDKGHFKQDNAAIQNARQNFDILAREWNPCLMSSRLLT